MDTKSEPELLSLAREFNQAALAEIYDRWSTPLYRYAMRLLGDSHLAEDCVSETYSRFLSALKRGKGPRDHLQAYLYRIAHNWITDRYRRNSPVEVELDPAIRSGEDEEPQQAVSQRLTREELRSALQHLTPDQQQVILLKFVENWENAEIARAINKPIGAVKALQHRAVQSLRRSLASAGEA